MGQATISVQVTAKAAQRLFSEDSNSRQNPFVVSSYCWSRSNEYAPDRIGLRHARQRESHEGKFAGTVVKKGAWD